jgi:hypothetical protein
MIRGRKWYLDIFQEQLNMTTLDPVETKIKQCVNKKIRIARE